MRCPSCGAADTRVVDSREAEEGSAIRRRRVCDGCEERFTTFERSESARIQVLKRDGTRQEFDRRKLASAIAKAATEDLTPVKVGALIDDVEQTIRQSGASEVSSDRIGQMVLERLAQADPMTYVRFKIVYDRLQDPDTLLQEVATLLQRRAEARDRLIAQQTLLPIAPATPNAARARRRR